MRRHFFLRQRTWQSRCGQGRRCRCAADRVWFKSISGDGNKPV